MVPTHGKLEATIVVVAKNTEPLLPFQAWSKIHVFKDRFVAAVVGMPVNGRAAMGWKTPIQAVTCIDHVVWFAVLGSRPEMVGNALLCPVVNAFDELPPSSEGWLSVVSRHDPVSMLIAQLSRQYTTPITNHENMVWTTSVKACWWQSHTVVVCGVDWRLGRCETSGATPFASPAILELLPVMRIKHLTKPVPFLAVLLADRVFAIPGIAP